MPSPSTPPRWAAKAETVDSAVNECEGIHADDVLVQAQGGGDTERRVDGAALQVVVDAICIDGWFYRT